MNFLLLTLVTASRLVLCPAIWLWCWAKRPRHMVLWMALVGLSFLVTDHFDGQWARRFGLVTEVGYWLDHVGDFLFYGVVVWTLVRGSREPPARRRGAGRPPSGRAPPTA